LQKRDCAPAYLQHNGLLVVQIIADGWLLPWGGGGGGTGNPPVCFFVWVKCGVGGFVGGGGGRSANAPVSCLQYVAIAVRYLVYFL